jgi:hypothetical protein
MAARVLFILLMTTALAGCEVIGDIFQAGMWVGVILVLFVVALIVWVMGKVRS